MSGGAMFRRVTGMRTGYHPEEVDDFFTHARTVYEQGPAGALSSRDVRTVAFDRGRQAWLETLAEQARSLYGRLTRPAGERFAHPKGRQAGYDAAEVDALCDRLVAYFDTNAPLTAQEVRAAVFARRKGARAYAEGPVDAFLERAVDVLLAAE